MCGVRNMRVSRNAYCLLAVLVLSLLLPLGGCKAELGKLGKLDLSALDFKTPKVEDKQEEPVVIPEIRVAMIAPLPLPDSVTNELRKHDKVLTGEFHSNSEAISYSSGYFIPKEYLFIIRKNIDIAAEMRQLELVNHETLGGIESGEYDIIVIPAVTRAKVDSAAHIALEAKLIDGKTFLPIRTVVVDEQVEERFGDPLQAPIHFVGSHKKDMQNQRALFSLTAYECAQALIDQIVKGAAS